MFFFNIGKEQRVHSIKMKQNLKTLFVSKKFQFIIVFGLHFFLLIAHMSLHLLPPFLVQLGASKTYVGFYINTNALLLVLYVVFFGQYTNRINKKKFLLISYLLFFLSLIFMFLFCHNLLIVLIFKMLSSISFAAGFSLHLIIALDLIPENRRMSLIAIFGVSGMLAGPIGTLIGEHVIKNYPPQYIYLASSIFVLITIGLIFLYHDHAIKSNFIEDSFWQILGKKKIRSFLIISFVFGGAYAVLATFIPNYSEEKLGVPRLSQFFIAFSAVSIIIRFLLFRFLDRLDKKSLIFWSLFSCLIAMVWINFLSSSFQLYLIGLFYGAGHSILFPSLSMGIIGQGKKEEKNSHANVFLAVNTLGSLITAILLGLLGDLFGTTAIFIFMSIILLLSLFMIGFEKRLPGNGS